MNNLSIEIFPNGVKVYQDDEGYKFTKDAIDLAKFCNIKHSDNVLEMCAGSGVISFYAYSLTQFNTLYLNEIQDDACEVIRKNIELNNLGGKAFCLSGNLKDLSINDFSKKLDVIICNPPYFKLSTQKINEDYKIALARHELEATLEDIIKKAGELIKDKGRMYLVMPTERLAEVVYLFKEYHFEPKRMKILINKNNEGRLAIFEAVYKGKTGLKVVVE